LDCEFLFCAQLAAAAAVRRQLDRHDGSAMGCRGNAPRIRLDDGQQLVIDRPADRGVQDLQANESRIGTAPLDDLAKIKGNYFIRLEAIEDVELRPNKKQPEMWIGVTGSEHHLFFPLAAEEEVQAFQRALSKGIGLR
jgi:hypothetical protein